VYVVRIMGLEGSDWGEFGILQALNTVLRVRSEDEGIGGEGKCDRGRREREQEKKRRRKLGISEEGTGKGNEK
jgi:hypothetical protein